MNSRLDWRTSSFSLLGEPKVSKANSINTCWLSIHIFSCFATLYKTYLNQFVLQWNTHSSSLQGMKHVRSFLQSVNHEVHRYFFISGNTTTPKYIKKEVLNHVMTLKTWSSVQSIAFSEKESKHVLRQTWHIPSTGNNDIIMWYLRIVWCSKNNICWSRRDALKYWKSHSYQFINSYRI